jgi:hypothetical protein
MIIVALATCAHRPSLLSGNGSRLNSVNQNFDFPVVAAVSRFAQPDRLDSRVIQLEILH